jgi:hypothetical protein
MSRRAAGDPEPDVRGLAWGAAQLGIGIGHARSLARAGQFPGAFRIGDRWRVAVVVFREEVENMARERARVVHPAGRGPDVEQLRLISTDAPVIPIAADSPSGSTIFPQIGDKPLSVLGPVDSVDIRDSHRPAPSRAATRRPTRKNNPQANGGKRE